MPATPIRQFRKTLRQFEHLLTTQLKDTCACTGVTMAQCHTLLEIEERGQATTGELADSFGLDKSTLSRTIDGLVRLGLIERGENPKDRRCTPLVLTEQGRKLCNDINKENDDYYQQVFNKIPAGQHNDVIGRFGQLVHALGEHSRLETTNACKLDIDE